MKKKLNRLRHRFIRFIYRCLRTDMVLRMRLNGFTWTKINGVLRVHRQKQIVKVERMPKGQRITYAYVALQEKMEKRQGRWQKVYKEPVPEVFECKTNLGHFDAPPPPVKKK